MRDDALTLVYVAIDTVNAQLSPEQALAKKPEAPLLGQGGGVDSLTFINLIFAIEEEIQKSMQRSVVLVDEDSLASVEHPFQTVGSLAAYVEKLVGKR